MYILREKKIQELDGAPLGEWGHGTAVLSRARARAYVCVCVCVYVCDVFFPLV